MNKQVVITISIGFFLAVIVFTGVFMFVMNSKQADSEPREQEIFYYDRAVKLYKNGSYIDAESALEELNARFPKSDSTRKANKDLADVKKLAQQQKEASVEKIAQEEAEQKKFEKGSEDKNPKINEDKQTNMEEIWDSYNEVLSANKYNIMYSGIKLGPRMNGTRKSTVLNVYVNDFWNSASEDVKKAYIEICVKTWGGMHGARGIPFSYEDWFFMFRHSDSNRILATWDSSWGTSLKD